MRKIFLLLFVWVISTQQILAQVYERDLGNIHKGYSTEGHLDMEIWSSITSTLTFANSAPIPISIFVKTLLPLESVQFLWCNIYDNSYNYITDPNPPLIIDGVGRLYTFYLPNPEKYSMEVGAGEIYYGWEAAPYFDYIINCDYSLVELGSLVYGFRHEEHNVNFLKQIKFNKREGQEIDIKINTSVSNFKVDAHLRKYLNEDNVIDNCKLDIKDLDDLHSIIKIPSSLSGDFQLTLCVSEKEKSKPAFFDYVLECSSESYLDCSYTSSGERSSIKTRVFQSPEGVNYLDKVQYFDGLGFPIQSVLKNASPTGQDIITLSEYDIHGRKIKDWLPIFAPTNYYSWENSCIKNNAKYFYEDDCPYVSSVYENSPREKIKQQYGAGYDWHTYKNDRSVVCDYTSNEAVDEMACMHFELNSAGAPKNKGCYPKGSLLVTKTQDEDKHIVYEFRNTQGQLILERKMSKNESFDTYYLYDLRGNLCYVLPPMIKDGDNLSEESSEMKKYAYIYRYDYRNRCIAKRLPGCGWVYYVYDKADQLIFTQDGVQRLKGEWSFSIPDAFGRPTLNGICKNVMDVSEKYVKAEYTDKGVHEGYILKIDDIESDMVLNSLHLVNYYDSYDFLSRSGFKGLEYSKSANDGRYGDDSPVAQYKHNGLLTGCMTALLDETGYMYSTNYYDDRERVIQTNSTNLLGGKDSEYFVYNYTNQIVAKTYIHSIPDKEPAFEWYQYYYDHVGRISSVNHQLDNQESVIIAQYHYDPVGRLNRKQLNDGMFSSRFNYNIRGWITDINNDYFLQSLHYTDGTGTPSFNGNISSMTWKTVNDTIDKKYNYFYDELNRLVDGIYIEADSLGNSINQFNEQVTGYDKLGNILGLKRYGQTSTSECGLIDHLTMDYHGNQLIEVKDSVDNYINTNYPDCLDQVLKSAEYVYDANGNLTKDLNKNITDIQYNCLNLPSRILFEDGNSISWLYDAAGVKLRTTYMIDGKTISTIYCGNAIYENGVLGKWLIEEGYITPIDSAYHYFIQDYQTSNRLVVNQNGTIEEVNHYYPFGKMFANMPSVQSYKYNGKELESTNGLDWYDYEARHYDPVLGRWHSIDPMSEKHYGISPYAYCANNPVRNIDPDGRDWIIHSSYNVETKKIEYKMSVRAVLYNGSSNQNINMNQLATSITQQINKVFTINTESFVSKMDFNIRVVNSVNEIGESDHVFRVVDQKELDNTHSRRAASGDVPADSYGFDVRISSGFVGDVISGTNTRTMAHELGHTGGLPDLPKAEKNKDRLMIQSVNAYGDPNKATRLPHSDITTIRDNYIHNRFKNSSPIKKWFGIKYISRQ